MRLQLVTTEMVLMLTVLNTNPVEVISVTTPFTLPQGFADVCPFVLVGLVYNDPLTLALLVSVT